ncbi:MAG: 3-phosphoshikimate 1-carboxyvinyltransferase [Ignavibacteriales bacterium]|nr:MAG: 3-phosphoshikimate 1-carboxyvinyltransferase [Ignavibacteriales bacterium]
MNRAEFKRPGVIRGELTLPGDKSISHRAVLFSALAQGESTIRNLSRAEDVQSSISCIRALGAECNFHDGIYSISSPGLSGFTKPGGELYAGNSGTTARLLAGILAVLPFESVITGDESLSRRPMKRVMQPLSLFGTRFEAAEGDRLPLKIIPAKKLSSVRYELPVASAQIKSAVLLAGLGLEERSQVIEKIQSRDHTERMLQLPFSEVNGVRFISSSSEFLPEPETYFVPGDISSAAFFVVAALLIPGSELLINNVTVNPTRTGYIRHLHEMGADISFEDIRTSASEPYGNIRIRAGELKNVPIAPELIPNLIDEIPILAVAGYFSKGDFEVRGAEELRVKESDRIAALLHNFKAAGARIEEFPDGFRMSRGRETASPVFESFHDHRIAMAFAIYSLLLEEGGKIDNFDCVKISNPDFINQLSLITG